MTTLQHIKKIGTFPGNISHMNRLCALVNGRPWDVYDLIDEYGGEADSVTREAIFGYIADKYHDGDYGKTYKRWMKGLTSAGVPK